MKFMVKDASKSGVIEVYKNGLLERMVDVPPQFSQDVLARALMVDNLLIGIGVGLGFRVDPDTHAPWRLTSRGWELNASFNGAGRKESVGGQAS